MELVPSDLFADSLEVANDSSFRPLYTFQTQPGAAHSKDL